MPLVGQRRPALPRTYSAVPSALAVLASGFGKGKSGRVPAAMAAATLAGPDPARPGAGVGFGYRIADTGRLAPPSPSPARLAKKKGGVLGRSAH